MKLKDLPTKYDFNAVEEGKYEFWVKNGFFTAGDLRKTFAIVIPPRTLRGNPSRACPRHHAPGYRREEEKDAGL